MICRLNKLYYDVVYLYSSKLKWNDGINIYIGKGKKSIWDQKFEFEIEYPIEEKKISQKLVFRVMDKHKLSDDGYVGEAT